MNAINNLFSSFLLSLMCFSCINSMNIELALFHNNAYNALEKSKELYTNITTLTIPQIATLLDQGADVNYQEYKKKPILMLTLQDYYKTQFLLSRGANVNDSYKDNTPLKLAMKKKNIPLIRMFLSYNPDDKHPYTLVHTNSRTMAKLFIKKGNLNETDFLICIYESLMTRRMKIAPLFIHANPSAQLAFNLFETIKNNRPDRTNQKEISVIIERLINLSDKDLIELQKYNSQKL